MKQQMKRSELVQSTKQVAGPVVPEAANEQQQGTPATLRQLGVPAALARDLESALRTAGATANGWVVGFTFRTPDDVRHEVMLEEKGRAA